MEYFTHEVHCHCPQIIFSYKVARGSRLQHVAYFTFRSIILRQSHWPDETTNYPHFATNRLQIFVFHYNLVTTPSHLITRWSVGSGTKASCLSFVTFIDISRAYPVFSINPIHDHNSSMGPDFKLFFFLMLIVLLTSLFYFFISVNTKNSE